jgi:hypothetical protein
MQSGDDYAVSNVIIAIVVTLGVIWFARWMYLSGI